jgi:TonB family protein
MVRVCLYVAFAASVLGFPIHSLPQDMSSGGADSVVAGPYGVPRLVMNEGGFWEEPIKVFENEQVITYVPDITTSGWAQWHIATFRAEGSYFTYLYVYRKDTRVTARVTITVYTAASKVRIIFSAIGPIKTFDIPKAPAVIALSIPHITAIVQDQADRFQGQTIEEAAKAQREAMGRLTFCYFNPEACSDTKPNRMKDPGKNSAISPPKPIFTPEAVYSEQGRIAKIEGIVLLSAVITTDGYAKDVKVTRPLGYGLDEAAVAAVRQYRFSPAIDPR